MRLLVTSIGVVEQLYTLGNWIGNPSRRIRLIINASLFLSTPALVKRVMTKPRRFWGGGRRSGITQYWPLKAKTCCLPYLPYLTLILHYTTV